MRRYDVARDYTSQQLYQLANIRYSELKSVGSHRAADKLTKIDFGRWIILPFFLFPLRKDDLTYLQEMEF